MGCQMNDIRLREAIARVCSGSPKSDNLASFVDALVTYGPRFGVDQPHRLAKLCGQVLVESGEFRYDREIWGPTAAQDRYDIRTDLGNTAARDGDGFRYRGRGPIQVTGGANYGEFTAWARKAIDPGAPDFYVNPDLINTDPWEGLSPLWFWSTRDLNRLADHNDLRGITKRINGGYNHHSLRVFYTDRMSLVLLGYDVTREDVRDFQRDNGLKVDGIIGDRDTRPALHAALLELA